MLQEKKESKLKMYSWTRNSDHEMNRKRKEWTISVQNCSKKETVNQSISIDGEGVKGEQHLESEI